MKSSYKILSLFGIDVEMHFTFIAFILGLFLFNSTLAALLLIVFAFVTAHEFVHSLVAKKYKIKVRKIILLPIGGMAVMNLTRVKPLTEVKIAVAGPLFNFLMCYVLIVLMNLMNLPFANAFTVIKEMNLSVALIVYYAFYANLVLGTFNLWVPAFPLDGGRILRAVLALKMNFEKATLVARNISLVIAVLMLAFALFNGSIWISIISFFIILGAIGEYNGLINWKYFSKIKAKDVLSNDFLLVSPNLNAMKLVEKMREKRTVYAVLKKEFRVVDLQKINDLSKKAGDYAEKVPLVKLNSKAGSILAKMNQFGIYLFPVVEDNKLKGVVKRIDIEKLKQVNQLIKNKYAK